MLKRICLLLTLLLLTLVGCAGPTEEPAEGDASPVPPLGSGSESAEEEPAATEGATGEERVVRLVTHDSFDVSEEVLAEFEASHDARIELVPLGDTGAMVNQSILSRNNPLGDVLFGVDNTFLTRALAADLFQQHESDALSSVPERFILDEQHRVTPIDYGDVCLNYDIGWFEERSLEAPDGLETLIDPAYEGLTVVMNPASSSPGLAFLLATVGHFGQEGWQDYWASLRENGVLVTAGWSEAYFDHFTAGGGEGDRPIVVSYASSPPSTEGATASVTSEGSCFRQIEFAGVLHNAENPELAKALIDFMLSPTFQADVPERMFVFPVVEGVPLPESFEQWAMVPDSPAMVDPQYIEENRNALIERWTEIVVR